MSKGDPYFRFSVAIPARETALLQWLEEVSTSSSRNHLVVEALKKVMNGEVKESDKLDRILAILEGGVVVKNDGKPEARESKIPDALKRNIMKELMK